MKDRYFPAIRRLAEYEIWCNARVFETAAALDEAQLRQPFPFGLGTIHKTLFHITSVFHTWSNCVRAEIVKPGIVAYDSQASLASISAWNNSLATAFLAAIDHSHAENMLHLDQRIEQVFHLVTHGTHHRTQFITMLRFLGKEPPFEAGDFGGWSNIG
jgi:uncharacterized damage-inducible protein DinB